MITVSYIIQLILLAVLVWQDFRYRKITWWILPLIFITVLGQRLYLQEYKEVLAATGFNLVFVGLQLLFVQLYMVIKERRFESIINRYIGLGDILFLVMVTAFFPVSEFIIFYVGGLYLALMGSMSYQLVVKQKTTHIPLAGWLGILLIFSIVVQYISPDIGTSYKINIISDIHQIL